jgi:hypothetical protein
MAFDTALEALARRAFERLGPKQVSALRMRPRDRRTREYAERRIEHAMWQEPALAAELESLVSYLDSRGGRRIIIEPEYPRNPFVVLLLLLGIGLCLTGLGVFGYTFLMEDPSSAGPEFDPSTKAGFAIFFAGFVVLALAGVAHGFTGNR